MSTGPFNTTLNAGCPPTGVPAVKSIYFNPPMPADWAILSANDKDTTLPDVNAESFTQTDFLPAKIVPEPILTIAVNILFAPLFRF